VNHPTPDNIRAEMHRLAEQYHGLLGARQVQDLVGQVSTPERDEIIDGIRECEAYPVFPDEAGLFLEHFVDSDGVDLATIPDTIWREMDDAMMEAKREAAFEVLNEFVRKLAPVVEVLP
jgi:hypothetical protein